MKWSSSVVSDSATPWTVAHQASPSMGFSWQEYWSRLPFPSPGDLPNTGIKPRSPALQADALTLWATKEVQIGLVKWKSRPALCNPMDSRVHGILQARILELWVAFPFSRRSSQAKDRTQVSHIAGGFFTS